MVCGRGHPRCPHRIDGSAHTGHDHLGREGPRGAASTEHRVVPPFGVGDFYTGFSVLANIITVVAGFIAIAGVGLAILARPRRVITIDVRESRPPQLHMMITSEGVSPVRHLELMVGHLDDDRYARSGDGAYPRAVLERNNSVTVQTHGPHDTFSGQPESQKLWLLEPADGFFVRVRSQSAVLPWLSSSETYAWPPSLRHASERPVRLTGRAERQFFDDIGPFKPARRPRRQRRSPLGRAWLAKQPLAHAEAATDADFDDLLAAHRGPVLVGFGAAWQKDFWEAIKLVLNGFAARNSPHVLVLTVATDENPGLAHRYPSTTFPYFCIFASGELSETSFGHTTVGELEGAFAHHLKSHRRHRRV